MKTTLATLTTAALLTAATTANGALIHSEDFNDNVANGWNLNASPGTSSTTLQTDPVNSTLSLHVDTGPTYQIAETPTLDLSGASKVTIQFDYADEDGGSTRFTELEFFNGSSWVLVKKFTQNTGSPDGFYTFDVTSGLAANNKFRIEGKNGGGGGNRAAFYDNIVIFTDDVIPEPGSLALLGLGGLLIGARRRRS